VTAISFQYLTTTFRGVCVLVVVEVGSPRIFHQNVTGPPTAEWTIQQLREFLPSDKYVFLTHDRDAIFSAALDRAAKAFGLRALKTPGLSASNEWTVCIPRYRVKST